MLVGSIIFMIFYCKHSYLVCVTLIFSIFSLAIFCYSFVVNNCMAFGRNIYIFHLSIVTLPVSFADLVFVLTAHCLLFFLGWRICIRMHHLPSYYENKGMCCSAYER